MIHRTAVLMLGVAAGIAGRAEALVFRVAPGGVGLSTTWTAPGDLVATLAIAGPGDTIEAAAGIYKPGTARTDTFRLNGPTLLGGFPAGGGPSADPELNVTVLSGDIGLPGVESDNCYHVVWSHGGTIDGFHIRGGNADGVGGGSDSRYGGGVYVNGVTNIARCKIHRNQALAGGGVYFYATLPGVSLSLSRTTIVANDATGARGAPLYLGRGGGLLAEGSDYLGFLRINRCSVLGNSATGDGGGVHVSMSIEMTNTVISGNDSLGGGGGGGAYLVSLAGPSLGVVRNCTIVNNRAEYPLGGAGAYLNHIEATNSIIWGNVSTGGTVADQQVFGTPKIIEFCDVQGWAAGGPGNLNAAPQFVDARGPDGDVGTEDDNLRLKAASVCRDAGRDSDAATPRDRDGRPRILRSKLVGGSKSVDLGAYEHRLELEVDLSLPTPLPPAGPR